MCTKKSRNKIMSRDITIRRNVLRYNREFKITMISMLTSNGKGVNMQDNVSNCSLMMESMSAVGRERENWRDFMFQRQNAPSYGKK